MAASDPRRRLEKRLRNLKGYLNLDRHGNEVVRRTDFTHGERPVLLLYGFMATRRIFEVLEKRLRRDGYCVWSINLGGLFDAFNTRGIDDCAEQVRDKVERLYTRYNLGPLSIIGHSKGGLIGRYYVKRLGGDKRCRTLITLGAPHNGTPAAYAGIATMGLVSKSVWQMAPMSPFIRRLKMGRFPPNVRFVSIYSKADRASPFPSCILEADSQANLFNVEVPGVTHREFVLKRSVYSVIRRELALGLGDPPRDGERPRPRLIES
ncbi:MAG TPA: permease [Myxococcales bacterium]|jgi:triacylglycerol esterase/lipase EstA (alpha/beta hydrolase family)|nr:permease [Myxococcales bacterium]